MSRFRHSHRGAPFQSEQCLVLQTAADSLSIDPYEPGTNRKTSPAIEHVFLRRLDLPNIFGIEEVSVVFDELLFVLDGWKRLLPPKRVEYELCDRRFISTSHSLDQFFGCLSFL